MKRILSLAACCILIISTVVPAAAQVTLVKGGKPTSRIFVPTDDKNGLEAAKVLKRFIGEISGSEPEILVTSLSGIKQRKGDVYILTDNKNPELTEDGFLISTRGESLRITGNDKGAIYGVVTLLEKYLGVKYWSADEYDVISSADIVLPLIEIKEIPAFRHRQSQNYAMATDPVYAMWNRLETPEEVFAGGYWVHTFNALLPSSEYGESHPEYYSYFNGKRHPGKASQWCLSNPEVLEIVTQRIDSIFRANPGKNIISVSQNDGNYTHCQCELCKAVDEYEGALSGSVIHFMNKLAERFPDKQISTLAYLYTMKPPKHVKPLPNVNIMLCSIDSDREVSLTENASGREFYRALEGWSAISDNIFVWDYGINFDNYLAPFPNFHIMGPNIRSFYEHNVTMHFSQIASVRGGDFAEMRTWLAAKLMWNPYQDTDSLIREFTDGYYGAAGPYIYRYTLLMQGALLGSGERLWIYDTPVTHANGMLKPELMSRYDDLFDQAEKAVEKDPVLLARVRRARLPLQYSQLEIDRINPDKDVEQIERKLVLLEQRANEAGAYWLNERNNTPQDYCTSYRERYLRKSTDNLAYGADVTFSPGPGQAYADLSRTALTDGVYGGLNYKDSWVGWEGIDANIVVDLGELKTISSIEADFLHQLGAWILFPKSVTYSISGDGTEYTLAGKCELEEDSEPNVKFKGVKHTLESPAKARYILIEVEGTKVCPHWHYGVGHPCWFFIDEITVL